MVKSFRTTGRGLFSFYSMSTPSNIYLGCSLILAEWATESEKSSSRAQQQQSALNQQPSDYYSSTLITFVSTFV